ncbi:hypothetical protein BDZ88DRAFT_423393 [Geranomyces variabilis]|nr:hypothetical protein BDZ88DRAFT_423393 [Geranomyces variabilis]
MSSAPTLEPCRWHLNVHDCRDSVPFIGLFWTSGILCMFIFAFGVITLSYRSLVVKHSLRNITLASFDSFLLFITFGYAGPVGIYFFMLAADAPHAITKKTWIVYPWQNLPWSFARLGFWVYIISVAQTTPRTGDRIYIPKGRHMNIFLRIIVFAEVFGTTPFAAAAGYAYDQYGNGKGFYILSAVVNVINAILSATLATGIYFYGKQMLIIVEHSMQGLRASMTTIGLSSVATQRSSVEVRLSKALIKARMGKPMRSVYGPMFLLHLHPRFPDEDDEHGINGVAHLVFIRPHAVCVHSRHGECYSREGSFSPIEFGALKPAPSTAQMLAARWWSIWQCTGGYLGVPLILISLLSLNQVVILWAEFFPPETPGDCASIIKSQVCTRDRAGIPRKPGGRAW